jgi:Mg-chelatase subunit ChlI
MMADVFFIQMCRLRSFRRGAAVTTEDCRWFYKSRAKATSRRRKKTEQDRGGGTQKNKAINPEKRSKQNTTQKIQREEEPTQKKNEEKHQKKKTELHAESKKKKGSIYTNKDCPCHCCIPTIRKTKEDLKTDIHSKPTSSLLILSSS